MKCTLQNPALPFLAHYHVLSFPSDQERPSREEADEIILIATQKARDLGLRYYADEECFSLIFNGKRTPRADSRELPAGASLTSTNGHSAVS